MHDETDLQVLDNARNRVSYTSYRNTLVEWTMSEAWTKPCSNQKVRGEVHSLSYKGPGYCSETSGEIDAH